MHLLLAGIALMVLSGFGALVLSRRPSAATALGAVGAASGCVLGLVPALAALSGAPPERFIASWDASHGPFSVEVDALSAVFLMPVLVLSGLAALYGAGYLHAYRDRKSLGAPWLFFNLFVAGMAMVAVARTALLFLIAWEVMSIAAYFLVTFEDEHEDVRRAGWIYLVATHCGAAFLFLAFLLLGRGGASPEFHAFLAPAGRSAALSNLIFVLALIGFGAKAGLVPFHVWLPEAHPAAPSHVSAVMSGAMIKMGLYGLLRVLTLLDQPRPWWGLLLATSGLITALAAIAFASAQRDLKRLLAYSSVENMGLIALALGIGLWGQAAGRPLVAALGSGACLLHMWNHALMKGLMFLSAGSVLHGTGTRDIEKLGGLMQRMPWTASLMTLGAVAIAALPPMNGFASKWMIYLGLLRSALVRSGSHAMPAYLAFAALAFVGGLGAVVFVRLVGVALLGSPRSEAARTAHESSPLLIGPMAALCAGCVAMAVMPDGALRAISGAVDQVLRVAGGEAVRVLAPGDVPLAAVGLLDAVVLAAAVLGTIGFLSWSRSSVSAAGPTWGCGYPRPTVRMQYTGRSFAEMLFAEILPGVLRPRAASTPVRGLFPGRSEFGARAPDPLLEGGYEPAFRRCAEWFSRLRVLQQGKTHVYLMYIVAMVVLALAWASLRTGSGAP